MQPWYMSLCAISIIYLNKTTKNTSLAAPGALAHRLQRRRDQLTLPKSKNGGHFSVVT